MKIKVSSKPIKITQHFMIRLESNHLSHGFLILDVYIVNGQVTHLEDIRGIPESIKWRLDKAVDQEIKKILEEENDQANNNNI